MPLQPATSSARAAAPADFQSLAAQLLRFLEEQPAAQLTEDGRILFELNRARWSVETGGGRCVLQVWSEERNLQRTVVSVEQRRNALRIGVRRLGQPRPQILHLSAGGDQRSPAARNTARRQFGPVLARSLARAFPDLKQGADSASADLEHSFGPAYLRTTLEQARAMWAVVAVQADETQATIDGIVTLGVLWLAHCRERAGGRRIVTGVRLIVPIGRAQVVRERVAWLNPALAQWEVWELDERHETLTETLCVADGNLASEPGIAFDASAVCERFAGAIQEVTELVVPEHRQRIELLARTPTELSFCIHGLEFARVRRAVSEQSFAVVESITFGAGGHETPLNGESRPLLQELVGRLFASRHPDGTVRDPLFRMQSERWLESEMRRCIAELEPRLMPSPIYTQVPLLAAGDRGMLDLLAVTTDGRLAVLELKTAEDLHMPLQGLDYWTRVRMLHRDGVFARAGYFPGITLSAEPPLLYFVVPALRVHSTFDTLMRHIAPEVEWSLLALDERWRRECRIIFRKHGGGLKQWDRVIAGGK